MVIADACFIFKTLSFSQSQISHLPTKNIHGKTFGTTSAKRTDSSDTSPARGNQPRFLSVRIPNPFLARSVVSVLGLGFIDAGFSGDWSRIGVITKESEDLLKIAAFLVVPFCIFLIFSFSKETDP